MCAIWLRRQRTLAIVFVQGDICDETLVGTTCVEHEIDAIVHFAAESHVDRSILSPRSFYETNVGGTLALLEVVMCHRIHFITFPPMRFMDI